MKKLNFLGVLAYLGVCVFIYLSVTRLTTDPSVFLNWEAGVVILGGLVVAAFASFPGIALKQSFHSLVKIVRDPPKSPVNEAREIVRLATVAQKSLQRLDAEVEGLSHPFLKEGVELMLDGISRANLQEILEKRVNERREILSQDVNVMMTLAKYCPALGLAATVLGLVELLAKLGDATLGQMGLGMAVALSATFYGIMIANLVFTPLSELLLASGDLDNKAREMIVDGLMSILDRKHPLVIGENMNSYLPIRDRFDVSAYLATLSPSDAATGPRAAA